MNKILYKLSKNGKKVQYWEIQLEGYRYRTVEGYVGGAMTESAWTYAEGKNIGKANETTRDAQAVLEVQSKITNKRDKGYGDNAEEASRPFGVTLAKKWEDYKDDVVYPVMVSAKYDGIRTYIKDGKLFYRSNKPVLSCQHLEINHEYVLDGELYNHELKDDFNKIVSLIRRDEATEETKELVKFYIFDVICDKPYAERLEIIQEIVAKNPNFVAVESKIAENEEQVDSFFDEYQAAGYEGAMIRWGNEGYIQERTNKLLKFKKFKEEEYEIVDLLSGKGKRMNTLAKWLLKTESGDLFEVGTTGTDAENLDFFLNKEKYIGKMATIKFQELTPAGIPRFGNFKAIREDI